MGWLWASATPAVKAPSPEDSRTSSSSSSSTTTAATTTPPSTKTSSDAEFQKFMDLLQSDVTASNASQPSGQSSSTSSSWFSSSTTSSSSSSSSRTAHNEPSPDTPLADPLAEALLPTEMSCRTAFDQAWACNSMGGQWNAIFRYGEMRTCSDQWDDFWFCMRTRGFSGEMREKLIREHYRGKERAKYTGGRPSSEDVWQSRSEKVAPGTVFVEPID